MKLYTAERLGLFREGLITRDSTTDHQDDDNTATNIMIYDDQILPDIYIKSIKFMGVTTITLGGTCPPPIVEKYQSVPPNNRPIIL